MRTVAPVHIGSGYKFGTKEYINEDGLIYFPDMGKLYQHLVSEGLDEKFEEWLLKRNVQSTKVRLAQFLKANGQSIQGYGGYTVRMMQTTEQGGVRQHASRDRQSTEVNEVSQFIRDAYGNPYIPGSSLKGAIRTILLNTHWKDENFVQRYGNGKASEKKDVVDWGAHKNKQFDDIFNEIRVSDSNPMSNQDLLIVQKWDYSARKQIATALPVYRESIAPFKVIKFEIVTTTERATELIKNLSKYASEFYTDYKNFYLSEQPNEYVTDNLPGYASLYLGSGSGVWTKTIFRQADGIVQNRYQRMKTKMIGKGVMKLTKAPQVKYKFKESVKTLVHNNESFYEMGKVAFFIEEVTQDGL